MKHQFILKSSLIAGLFAFAASSSVVATAEPLAVTAKVKESCTITTTDLVFPELTPDTSVAMLEGEGQVQIACTKKSIPTILIDLGANDVGGERYMKEDINGVETLKYALFQPVSNDADALCGFTVPWGAGLTVDEAPSKAVRNYNVCGGIALADQDVPAGDYSDEVVVTVSF
ncbi:Csu type fimbrial protein [Massilia glaciei]|uniref:SCPU domain-containing protein n=1 Tax=Massilia glaciei TaxID=1524097 RepID=A0A2U2HIW2_9BURK|nr:spore coat U domain-containing protein [Massilia glaciei]PWF46766.1 SCPU domain-containing protein [Massilia glaciei]